jgi:hypothetical protein
MSSTLRNVRDTFLHFLADNLPVETVHPIRFDKTRPHQNIPQLKKLNVAFHDADYSSRSPASQFVTLDILHDDELYALDLEESVVGLLTLGGQASLLDYSTQPAVQVANRLVFWNTDSIQFRTVASTDYFHRSAFLELYVRYA